MEDRELERRAREREEAPSPPIFAQLQRAEDQLKADEWGFNQADQEYREYRYEVVEPTTGLLPRHSHYAEFQLNELEKVRDKRHEALQESRAARNEILEIIEDTWGPLRGHL